MIVRDGVYYLRSPDALWRATAEEVIVASAGGEEYELLSATAAAVWRLLAQPMSIGDLSDRLAADFGEEPGRIEADVEPLLGWLADRGLVQIVADGDD